MKTACWIAIAAIGTTLLSGCATSRPVDRTLHVSDETRQEVKRLLGQERQSNQLVYRLSTVGADQCADAPLRYRTPFSLLFNSPALPSAEMRTAIFQEAGIDSQALFQAHLPEFERYDGAHVVAVNGESTANPNKVLGAMLRAAKDRGKLSLRLEDGSTIEALPQPACPSLVYGDFTGIARQAEGMGIFEMQPTAWAKLARSPDEMAFILARSIYFTGAEGEQKLRHALYAGAAVSGVLRAVTFGVSSLVADPKRIAVHARRRANLEDADAFAVQLMRRAGFDVNAALTFAQRSIDEGSAWPKECEELHFDQARLDALRINAFPKETL
jgi:hypothetical protein